MTCETEQQTEKPSNVTDRQTDRYWNNN